MLRHTRQVWLNSRIPNEVEKKINLTRKDTKRTVAKRAAQRRGKRKEQRNTHSTFPIKSEERHVQREDGIKYCMKRQTKTTYETSLYLHCL